MKHDQAFLVTFDDEGDGDGGRWDAYVSLPDAVGGAQECFASADYPEGRSVWITGFPSGTKVTFEQVRNVLFTLGGKRANSDDEELGGDLA